MREDLKKKLIKKVYKNINKKNLINWLKQK